MNITITQEQKCFDGLPQFGGIEISAFHYIPLVDYDKTYYYLNIRSVTACKIKGVVIGYEDRLLKTFFIITTPIGTKIVKMDDIRFFHSAEDCLQYTIGNATPVKFTEKTFKEIFPEECRMGYQSLKFKPTFEKGYYFSARGGKIEVTTMPMRCIVFVKDGCLIGIDKTRINLCEKVYLSKEDCVKAEIDGIQIMDFAEDETEPCKVQKVSVSEKKREPRVVTLRFIEQ